jgi:hypothetical protein
VTSFNLDRSGGDLVIIFFTFNSESGSKSAE